VKSPIVLVAVSQHCSFLGRLRAAIGESPQGRELISCCQSISQPSSSARITLRCMFDSPSRLRSSVQPSPMRPCLQLQAALIKCRIPSRQRTFARTRGAGGVGGKTRFGRRDAIPLANCVRDLEGRAQPPRSNVRFAPESGQSNLL